MLVDLPAEWQVGSKLQLAAENRGSGVQCTNLNSLRETADALQDALVFPSFHLFRGYRVFSHHGADHRSAQSVVPHSHWKCFLSDLCLLLCGCSRMNLMEELSKPQGK